MDSGPQSSRLPSRSTIAIAAVVLVVAIAIWPRQVTQPRDVPAEGGGPGAAPVTTTGPATGEATTAPAEQPQPPVRPLRMPDGSQLPPLNGVREAGDPTWPPDRPYAKVVGTKTVNGIDYYVHADGSTTTTIMVWRTDLGRYDAATHVVNPIADKPLADDELPGQPGQRGQPGNAPARKRP